MKKRSTIRDGYLKSLPEREDLPVFWSEEELEMLKGTEVKERVMNDRQSMESDFNAHVRPLLERYPEIFTRPLTLQDFMNAASLVSSRSFFVDKHHGHSMVPFADVFNHKCAVVAMDADHGLEGAPSDEDPCMDLSNIPQEYRLEINICSGIVVNSHQGLEIRAAKKFQKEQEIHNTYGEHGNEELLCKYGFCIKDNIFDVASIDSSLFLDNIKNTISPSIFKSRFQLLQSVQWLPTSMMMVRSCGYREEGDWEFEVYPDGRLSWMLWLTLRVAFADDDNAIHAVQSIVSQEAASTVDLAQHGLSPSACHFLRDFLSLQLHEMPRETSRWLVIDGSGVCLFVQDGCGCIAEQKNDATKCVD